MTQRLADAEKGGLDTDAASRYVDHPMKGEYNDCRECHLRPDLVLVYRKLDPNVLELIRIGTTRGSLLSES